MSILPRRRMLAALIAGIWFVTAAAGTVAFIRGTTRDTARGATPGRWPPETRLPRDPGRATLLMFVHPNCPCTRASVSRLATIIGDLPEASRPRTVFVARAAASSDWRVAWFMEMVGSVPGAIVVRDRDTIEARRFGAMSSGHVLLYGVDGTLRFDGGVTAGRGHEGANDASAALARALSLPRSGAVETAVFGCAIDDRSAGSGSR